MNNFHIYEEVGKGKYSVVYKVSYFVFFILFRAVKKSPLTMLLSNPLKKTAGKKS
jgi:hypothetical protein